MRLPAAPRRRRLSCLGSDKYMLIAGGAFVVFVLMINLVSQGVEQQIHSAFDEARAAAENSSAAAEHVARPWTPTEVNKVDLARRQGQFATTAATDALALVGRDLHGRLALIDTALLTRAVEAAEAAAAVEALVDATVKDDDDVVGLADALGAVDSTQTVLQLRGYSAEADVCEQQRRRLLRERAADAEQLTRMAPFSGEHGAGAGLASNRYGLRFAVDRGADAAAVAPAVVAEVTQQLNAKPLNLDSIEYILDAWILKGGRRSKDGEALRVAYTTIVNYVIRQRFHTVRVSASNFTYVTDGSGGTFHPSVCGLPATLARGIRHHAHPKNRAEAETEVETSTTNPTGTTNSTAPALMSGEVLQAAEALAATCLRLFADSATNHLEVALRYTYSSDDRPPFSLVDTDDPEYDRCAMPVRLLRTFYELYVYTQDPAYVAWAAYVMSGDAPHCPVFTAEGDAPDRKSFAQYSAELRYFSLLAVALDCDLYRGAIGARGVCNARSSTIVSYRHRLVLLPSP